MHWSISGVLIFAIGIPSAWGQNSCVLSGRPMRGLRVTSTVVDGAATIDVVAHNGFRIRFCDLDSGTLLPLTTMPPDVMVVAGPDGFASSPLRVPLRTGQKIQAQVEDPAARAPTFRKAGDTIIVPGSVLTRTAGAAMVTLQILGAIREGVTSIPGVISPASGATIQILDLATGAPLPLTGGGTSVTATAATGAFTAALASPLNQGQMLRILINGDTATPASDSDFTVTGLADWGRVRIEFAAGMVLSADNNFQASSTSGNSTQTTLFMGLNAEKNWKWAGTRIEETGAHWTGRWMFNTFFQTRLTSVPVTTCQASSASGSCDNLTTFLNSAKSAELQGGAYLPFLITRYTYKGIPYSIFVAPLAKLGFITPTGSTTTTTAVTTPATAATPATGTTPATPATPAATTTSTSQAVNQGQFYNFYGLGGRTGLFQHSADKGSAPEAKDYIDVVVGKFSNLETLVPVYYNLTQVWATNSQGVNAPLSSPIRRWRIAIEGVVKIPSTPLVLGVSANLGQNLFNPTVDYCGGFPGCVSKRPLGAASIISGAKDDLRFFVGTSFDVGKLVARIPAF